MYFIENIQNRIYELRGERVMLDFDLAELYEVATKALNQAVKRNISRFPGDFMFRLSLLEWEIIQTESAVVPQINTSMRSQFVTSSQNKRKTNLTPYAFTEQGVAMLSGVLHSDKAIKMNIAIMRAFVEIRRIAISKTGLKQQLDAIKQRIGEHDVQLSQIYDAIENLLDETAAQNKWNDRERIGFKTKV